MAQEPVPADERRGVLATLETLGKKRQMTRYFLKAVLICIAACVTLNRTARAAANGGGFSQGNAFYAAGDFAGAAGAYEAQVRRGEYTANLFYNLADAYYRQGNRGRAVLNYQRALILDPSHAEAAANLAFVRGVKPAAPASGGWIVGAVPWLTAAAFLAGDGRFGLGVFGTPDAGRRVRAAGHGSSGERCGRGHNLVPERWRGERGRARWSWPITCPRCTPRRIIPRWSPT